MEDHCQKRRGRSGRNGPLTGRYGKIREEWTTDGEIWKDQGGMDH